MGNAPLVWPEKRGFWVHEKITHRYHKTLKAKTFDDYDLEEFSGSLKQYIEAHSIVKTWVEKRLYFTGRFPADADILRELRKDRAQAATRQDVCQIAKVLRRKVSQSEVAGITSEIAIAA